MNENELLKLIKERWTARKFKSKKIEDEALEKILEAGRWAPSGGNKQPWELVIIKDDDLKRNIAELYSETGGFSKSSERYTKPPILIAVCIDTRTMESYPKNMPKDFITYAGIGTMVQNMSLMATSLGLSLSWGTQPEETQDKLKKLLKIPEYLYIPDILQLGYSDQQRFSTNRREIDEFVHINTIDLSKLRDL